MRAVTFVFDIGKKYFSYVFMDRRRLFTCKKRKKSQEARQEKKLSETWAQDALGDLEDWIEEQGIYIRQ